MHIKLWNFCSVDDLLDLPQDILAQVLDHAKQRWASAQKLHTQWNVQKKLYIHDSSGKNELFIKCRKTLNMFKVSRIRQ